jgi:hypothetical protein
MRLNHLEEEIYGRADHSAVGSSLSRLFVTSTNQVEQGDEVSSAETRMAFANRNHEDEIFGGAHNLEV